MAINTETGSRIEASFAPANANYTCPECGQPVILRRGAVRLSHFSHRCDTGCSLSAGETVGHQLAKLMLYQTFLGRGLRCEPEVSVRGSINRRADVMVWSPDGQQVALEVQHSNISLEDIYARTADYFSIGIPVVWIVLAREGWFTAGKMPHEGKIDGYAAPDWQQWIHGYNLGTLWFADIANGVIIPAHLVGQEGSRHKALMLREPVSPHLIKIRRYHRPGWEKGRYKFPEGVAARLVSGDNEIGNKQRTPEESYPWKASRPRPNPVKRLCIS